MPNSNSDDKKTMDVSKPGKTAADATSRPVIINRRPMVQDPMVKVQTDVSDMEPKQGDEPAPKSAPTAGEKVIQPLGDGSSVEAADVEKAAAAAVAKKQTASTEVDPGEKPTEPEAGSKSAEISSKEDTAKATEASTAKSPEPKENETKESTRTSVSAETTKDTKSARTEKSHAGSQEATSSNEQNKPSTGSSETAEVDAVADQASSGKHKDKQAAEQAAAKQEHLQKLIDNKKYFVKTGQVARRRNNRIAITFLVLIVLVIGLYIAVDAKVISIGYDVPVQLIKN